MIFEVGATVRLRSGGPLMTIVAREGFAADSDSATPIEIWRCAWFHDMVAIEYASLDQRALYRDEPPK